MPKDPLDCTNTDAYIALKYAIRQHLEQGLWPELSESKKPIGGYNWQPRSPSIIQTSIQEMDLFGEGEDPLAVPTDFEPLQ